jgi:hypothetical protein
MEQLVLRHLALPYHERLPSSRLESHLVSKITSYIPLKLPLPERAVATGHVRHMAAGVLMPEAPTHFNHRTVFWENYIRAPRQATVMQTKAKTRAV